MRLNAGKALSPPGAADELRIRGRIDNYPGTVTTRHLAPGICKHTIAAYLYAKRKFLHEFAFIYRILVSEPCAKFAEHISYHCSRRRKITLIIIASLDGDTCSAAPGQNNCAVIDAIVVLDWRADNRNKRAFLCLINNSLKLYQYRIQQSVLQEEFAAGRAGQNQLREYQQLNSLPVRFPNRIDYSVCVIFCVCEPDFGRAGSHLNKSVLHFCLLFGFIRFISRSTKKYALNSKSPQAHACGLLCDYLKAPCFRSFSGTE